MKRKNANTLSPRDRVENEVFRLQQLAVSALPPTPTGKKRLPGESVPAEEDALRRMLVGVSDSLDDLEQNVIPKLRDPADRDHLYHLLYYFITAARLIGSRAQVSKRQENFFKSTWAVSSSRKGVQAREHKAATTWHPPVIALAQRGRTGDPHIPKEKLATDILDAWPSGIKKLEHRTVVKFLTTLEKDGRLPKKIKKMKSKKESPST